MSLGSNLNLKYEAKCNTISGRKSTYLENLSIIIFYFFCITGNLILALITCYYISIKIS